MTRVTSRLRLLLAVCLTACGGSSDPGPFTVQIDASQTSAIDMAIGAQLDDHAAFDAIAGAPRLDALAPTWFRIHAGADNDVLPEPAALPGRGAWDFSGLNRLVDIGRQAGATVLLNVRTAPVALATCSTFHAAQGTLTDPSFGAFADYMASLVAYYNLGAFTDAGGTAHVNPQGTARRIDHWEIWNEPDLPYEFPCLQADGQPSLSVADYRRMWDVTTQRMRAVDPQIRFVGPAVSDPSLTTYLDAIAGSPRPPDLISAHSYAGPNSALDAELLNGGRGATGVVGLGNAVQRLIAHLDASGRSTAPVLIDEFNISPDGEDDPAQRGWSPLGVALGTSMYIRLARQAGAHPMALIPFQFVEASGLRLTSLDPRTGTPLLPYWRDRLLRRAAQPGDVALAVNPSTRAIEALAVRGSGRIGVLLAHTEIDPSGIGTRGPDRSVVLNLVQRTGARPSRVTLQLIDSTTDPALGPATVELDPGTAPVVTFKGHGMAWVEWID